MPGYDGDGDRINTDRDGKVWVVGWKTSKRDWSPSAVLTSHREAAMYASDLRAFLNDKDSRIPDDYEREYEVEIRTGGRKSPTPLYEEWPPSECTRPEDNRE